MEAHYNTALKIENIAASYGKKKVFDQLCFEVRQNEIFCLLGKSGSGKTTVLKAIAGLMPIEAGSMNLNGRILSSAKQQVEPEQRDIGIIFQDFALFPHLTVLENVCFGIKASGESAQQKAIILLAMVKMAGFESAYPSELSGGQQQRVAIARALAVEPKVLLLDEPFSNVDHHLRESLMLDIKAVLKQQKTPAIFVTHSKEEAFTFADTLAFMESGKIVQQGSAESLYFQPATASLAESMGEGNWLEVLVTSEITTKCQYLDIISATMPHNAALSSIMHQFIRPHQISITPDMQGQAEIVEKVFNGETRIYFVQIADRLLRISTSSSEDWAIGTRVRVAVIPHQAVLFDVMSKSL